MVLVVEGKAYLRASGRHSDSDAGARVTAWSGQKIMRGAL